MAAYAALRAGGAMKPPRRHRNVTARRLLLDAYQFFRCQSFVIPLLGRPFQVSREAAEIDITYKCNLHCLNCNRSCTQAPSRIEMPVSCIESFLQESVEKKIQWQRIRILGGEPTLHSRFWDILDRLRRYRADHNPSLRIVLGTNYFGRTVQDVIRRLPADVEIKSTIKQSPQNLFRPFNVAPVDTPFHRFSDFSAGCRIIRECGLGVTPSGYYMCAVAGGIDRIFGYGLGRGSLPDSSDPLTDQMRVFCRLCGHFGFQWPVRREKMSPTWKRAYQLRRAADSKTGPIH